MNSNPNFILENQYQMYLKRMALKESDMHKEQKKQLREAFFGACGQIIMLLRDEVSKLEEPEAVEVMQNMIRQVFNHFTAIENKN